MRHGHHHRHPTTFTELIESPPDFSSQLEALAELESRPHPEYLLLREQATERFLAPAGPAAPKFTRVNQVAYPDKDAFKNAVTELVRSGKYKRLALIHAEMSHMMHSPMGPMGQLRFLGWHRRYVSEFETMLDQADLALRPGRTGTLAVPYWDWNDPFPAWLDGFLPQNHPATGTPLPARANSPFSAKPDSTDIDYVLNHSQEQFPGSTVNDYVRFTYTLEGFARRADNSRVRAHNHGHVYVGGIMNDTSYSPADPVFWLHHAQVDRLWAIWQASHPGIHPTLSGANAIFDPWPEKYDDVVRTEQLNYVYL